MSEPRYLVRIAFPGDGHDFPPSDVTKHSADLAVTIAAAIRAHEPPRICQLVADVIDTLDDRGDLHACCDELRTAVQQMVDGARAVRECWREHDEERDRKA